MQWRFNLYKFLAIIIRKRLMKKNSSLLQELFSLVVDLPHSESSHMPIRLTSKLIRIKNLRVMEIANEFTIIDTSD